MRPRALIGLFCGTLALGLYRTGTTGTVFLSIAAFLAVVLLAMWISARPLNAVIRHARRMRPTSAIVPAYTTAEMIDLALACGASISGWPANGGAPVALTVTNTALELWSGTEVEPRMVLPRDGATKTTIVMATYNSKTVQALGIRSASSALMLIPAYKPAYNKTRPDTAGLQTALATLRRP